ncbi:MAG: NAD(P)H-binding protein [Chrysiogenetes bacterium]|nr:NAD(P)H-binding protein [Chrysiogenetes bacterium]
MIVFLTGTNSFIGEAILREFVGRGDKVRALVEPGTDLSHLSDVKFEKVEGSLSTFDQMRLGAGGAHAIVHAEPAATTWYPDYESARVANVIGTKNLISVARGLGIKRIVVVGGIAASVKLPSHWANSVSDALTAAFSNNWDGPVSDMEIVAVHPGVMVGPRDRGPSAFGRLLIEALRGEGGWLPAGGIPLVDVRDAARNIAFATNHGVPGSDYNFIAEYLKLGELFQICARIRGEKPARPLQLPGIVARELACVSEFAARASKTPPRVSKEMAALISKGSRSLPDGVSERRTLRLEPYRPAEESLADAFAWWAEAGLLPRESASY